MGIVRNQANTLRRGRVGQDTFYISRGRQIVRQAQNNSNYGETASRSAFQQRRRIQWGNLVNMYKVLQPVLQKAYETKKQNQSFYNRFMQLNMNGSRPCLTKTQADEGCCVADSYVISQGSLRTIQQGFQLYDFDGAELYCLTTDVKLSSGTYNEMTVKAFSEMVIQYNSDFQNGDAIGFVIISQDGLFTPQHSARPRCRLHYVEFTLDVDDSTNLVGDTPFDNIVIQDSVTLGMMLSPWEFLTPDDENFVMSVIHVRKDSGRILTSTQKLDIGPWTVVDDYAFDGSWIMECMRSYGVDVVAPLRPGAGLN